MTHHLNRSPKAVLGTVRRRRNSQERRGNTPDTRRSEQPRTTAQTAVQQRTAARLTTAFISLTLIRELSRPLFAAHASLAWPLQTLLIALTFVLLFPPPREWPVSSANTGARFFGALALLIGLLGPDAASGEPMLLHLAPWLPTALLAAPFLGSALLLGALASHRLGAVRARRYTPGEHLRRTGWVNTGDLQVRSYRHGGETLLMVSGPDARFLVTVSNARPHQGAPKGSWQVDLPDDGPDGRSELVREAARLNAKPLIFARRGPLDRASYPKETHLHLPYTILLGDHDEFLELAGELHSMATRLRKPAEQTGTPAEQARAQARQTGLDLEQQSLALIRAHLPFGWGMRQNVVLLEGGDADLVVNRPDGRMYVIDIKLRKDDPALPAQPGRVHDWTALADQAEHAARQLGGLPLIWQPLAPDGVRIAAGRVPVLGGDALNFLNRVGKLNPPN